MTPLAYSLLGYCVIGFVVAFLATRTRKVKKIHKKAPGEV